MNYIRQKYVRQIRAGTILFVSIFLAACVTPVDDKLSFEGAPPEFSQHRQSEVRAGPLIRSAPGAKSDDVILIGSFNIQNLGPTKASRPDVMMRLAEIIRRFDAIAIQEVSDVSEKTPGVLLDYIHSDGSSFDYVLSPRSGREPDDRTSQEQYAIYYDTSVIHLVEDFGVFDDSGWDEFQREPQVAEFRTSAGEFQFALVNIHTRPASALAEIAALERAAQWTTNKVGDVTVIILGDFNGGCNYAKPAELSQLGIRGPKYVWVIPDTADTNLSMKKCPYDRIVLTDGTHYTGKWSVWRAFRSTAISDHWPVWAAFTNKE